MADQSERLSGTKAVPNSEWINPLHLKRSLTDRRWLICWVVTSCFCLISGFVAITCFFNPPVKLTSPSEADKSKYWETIAIYDLLAASLTILYILTYRWLGKNLAWTINHLVCLFLFGGTLYFGYTLHYVLFLTCFSSLLLSWSMILIQKTVTDVSCEIIAEACRLIIREPLTLLMAIIPTVLTMLLIVYAFWIFTSLYIFELYFRDNLLIIIFFEILHYSHVFYILWLYGFIFATSRMILSMTFGARFWITNKSHLLKAAKVTLRYHLGTASYGSLVVAPSEILAFIGTVNSWCLWCKCNGLVDEPSRIDRTAYVETAIRGTNFSTSASNSFSLRMRSFSKTGGIREASHLILRTGKFFIVILTIALKLSYDYLTDRVITDDTENVFVVLWCYIMINSVLQVLRVAVDIVYETALEDSERNDGSESKPYITSDRLRELILNPPGYLFGNPFGSLDEIDQSQKRQTSDV